MFRRQSSPQAIDLFLVFGELFFAVPQGIPAIPPLFKPQTDQTNKPTALKLLYYGLLATPIATPLQCGRPKRPGLFVSQTTNVHFSRMC